MRFRLFSLHRNPKFPPSLPDSLTYAHTFKYFPPPHSLVSHTVLSIVFHPYCMVHSGNVHRNTPHFTDHNPQSVYCSTSNQSARVHNTHSHQSQSSIIMRKGPRNKPLLIRCDSHSKLNRFVYNITHRHRLFLFFPVRCMLACRCSFQANENQIGHYKTAYVWILSVARIYVFHWWFLLGVFSFLLSVCCWFVQFLLVCLFLLLLLFRHGFGDSFNTCTHMKLHGNRRYL